MGTVKENKKNLNKEKKSLGYNFKRVGYIVGLIMFGWNAHKSVSEEGDKNFNKVPKGTYITNSEIESKYITIEKHKKLIEENNTRNMQKLKMFKEDPENVEIAIPVGPNVEIIPGDSADYYGIVIISDNKYSKNIIKIRDKIRNEGFRNTEIFKDIDGNFNVVNYGHQVNGWGLKRILKRIQSIIYMESCKPIIMDLRKLAPEGFKEYREKTYLKYYISK